MSNLILKFTHLRRQTFIPEYAYKVFVDKFQDEFCRWGLSVSDSKMCYVGLVNILAWFE